MSNPAFTAQRRRVVAHFSDPLYRTGYLLTAGAGVTSALGLVFWILAARSYPARVVGVNSAAISAMLFVSSVCQLGLPAVLVRYLPSTGAGAGRLIAACYGLVFAVSLAIGAAAAATSGLWSHSLRYLEHGGWIAAFAVATAFYTIFQVQDWVMTGLDSPQWVPLENTLFSLTKLILLVALVAVAPFSGPFVAWNIPALIAAVLVTLLIYRRLLTGRRRRSVTGSFDRRRFVTLATANQLALLFTYTTTLLMPVIVSATTTAATTAYFYVPWTLAGGILLFAVTTTASLTVEASLDEAQMGPLTRRTLVHTLRIVVPLAVAEIVLAPLLLRLYGPAYAHHGVGLMRLLALAAIPNAAYTVGEALLRLQHRPVLLFVTQAGQAVLFLVLSLVLIHPDGIEGVGIAFLIAQAAGGFGLLATTMRPYVFTRTAPTVRAG